MRVIRNFWQVQNLQTAAVIALSLIATYLCIVYKIVIELPTTLIGIAIVFAIVFSINAAYRRREEALIYRTPTALRAYSQVFLNAFPVLFAPYFASLSEKSFFTLGFIVAGVYGLVLVSLDNIQERLENPFDEFGVDDVKLDVVDDYRLIVGRDV